MDPIRIVHRVDDEYAEGLRESMTRLAAEVAKIDPMGFLTFRTTNPIIEFICIMQMLEVGEWGADAPSIEEIIDRYAESFSDIVPLEKRTPIMNDCIAALTEQMYEMYNIGYSPLKLSDIEEIIESQTSANSDEYTITGYDIGFNPIAFLVKIEPTVVVNEIVTH